MPVGALNHINIYAVDLEASRRFWRDVLGFEDGDRPPLGFPGHWMWSGGAPTVHLVGPRDTDGDRPPRRAGPTGQFDHVAPPTKPGISDQWGPGTRIPALVVSPLLKHDFAVDSTSHDTTSIMATVERVFDVPPLTSRDASVADLLVPKLISPQIAGPRRGR